MAIVTGAAEPGPHRTIVLEVRAPRVVLGAVTGAGLAVIGTTLQALVRQSAADPFLLGVSSGASAGAVAVIVLGAGAGVATTVALPAAAFAGALAALVLVYALARRAGSLAGGRLVLAGVAVSYVLSALTSLILVHIGQRRTRTEVLHWTLGGLGAPAGHARLARARPRGRHPAPIALARPLDLLLSAKRAPPCSASTPGASARPPSCWLALTGVLVATPGRSASSA